MQQLKSTSSRTSRYCVEALEEYIDQPIKILDHGFIRLVDYMGGDTSIVEAARVSYGKGTRKSNEDKGLIRYLMRHRHTSPFEMCEIKMHIKMPIFVARQWLRHRMASVNEYSARYSILDREFYLPEPHHLAAQSALNKQARDEATQLDPEYAQHILGIIKRDSLQSYQDYEDLLRGTEERPALARELARINLPVNFYTQCYWKIDLHNLLHFISLRNDPHAQYEIRVYAEEIAKMVQKWVPLTARAFEDYTVNSVRLSAQAITCLKKHMNGEEICFEDSDMSKGEWNEFENFLDTLKQTKPTAQKPHNKKRQTNGATALTA
jgi:thymidylate synthase (FAD)